jgi:hypothetical protein
MPKFVGDPSPPHRPCAFFAHNLLLLRTSSLEEEEEERIMGVMIP